ncbi:hypothetical protein EPI10_016935 [Gossypium australe]|uniref:Uncharacterized protein n=1 Tax=Gossypium australe TaxID=47621 RepID=A0A5B6VQG6_9ROSI|nr:hypothetical protein EPI10_016935 [Gossypium australe]
MGRDPSQNIPLKGYAQFPLNPKRRRFAKSAKPSLSPISPSLRRVGSPMIRCTTTVSGGRHRVERPARRSRRLQQSAPLKRRRRGPRHPPSGQIPTTERVFRRRAVRFSVT